MAIYIETANIHNAHQDSIPSSDKGVRFDFRYIQTPLQKMERECKTVNRRALTTLSVHLGKKVRVRTRDHVRVVMRMLIAIGTRTLPVHVT